MSTFPKHYHDGDEYVVVESRLSESQEDALRQFLRFARERLLGH